MKTRLHFRYGWPYALVLSVIISCKQSDSGDVTPTDPTCQVQLMNTVTVDNGKTSNSSSLFSYDPKGQLLSIVTGSAGSGSAKTTETYTYDDEGYAMTYKYVYSNGALSSQTRSETYSYVNGRLSMTTFKVVSQYTATLYETDGTTAYSYDASGALTQKATLSTHKSGLIGFSSSSTSSSIYSYANGMLTTIKELVNNKASSTTYTIENGRITVETNATGGGSKKRYTYDADGYQIIQESFNANNVVSSTMLTEYGSFLMPKSVYPVQKGFPVIPPSYGKEDKPVSRYTNMTGGTIVSAFQYQYQLNSKGYPVQLVETNAKTTTKTTSTFTYTNCSQ